MSEGDINLVPKMQETWADHCAYCGAGIDEVVSTLHRDGFGKGPEVPLCALCFHDPSITLKLIWAKIANPEPVIEAIKQANEVKQIGQVAIEIWKEENEVR